MKELGVQYKLKSLKNWIDIARWKIGRCTFNQLGEVWLKWGEFRIKESASDCNLSGEKIIVDN